MTRIVITSTPGIGHVLPMLPLSAALVAQGHDVHWAVAEESCALVAKHGFDVTPAGLAQVDRFLEYRRRYPESETLPRPRQPPHMFPHMFGEVATPVALAALLPLVESWRPDVIVHDAAEFGGPIAAAVAGIPHAAHGFGPLTPEPFVRDAGDVVAGFWREHGLEPRPYGGLYDYLLLDIYPPSLHEGTSFAHVPHVQPIRPATATASDEVRERPLVYVTFGTVFNDTARVFPPVLAGVGRLPVDVLVTIGANGDPAALGDLPANVRVEKFVPQAEVLPRCDLVVSHGGSGTVLATLAHGVPQVVVPQGADQFVNARHVAASGAGLVLPAGTPEPDAVAAAASRVLDEPSFREVAGRIAAEIAAMPSPDDAARAVVALSR